METRKQYLKIGEALADDKLIKEIVKDIIECRSENHISHPFYVVDAPSGSGKTQLAFALYASGLKVVHIMMVLERSQKIYSSLTSVSASFLRAVEYDKSKFKKNFEIETLRVNTSYSATVQWISEMMVHKELISTEELPTVYSILEMINCITAMKEKRMHDHIPVFVLDEAVRLDDKGKRMIRLGRNILRAIGFVCMIMGTNTCAVNLARAAKNSRSDNTDPPLWCKLITRLPKVNKKTRKHLGVKKALKKIEDQHPKLRKFLSKSFKSSSPYFVLTVCQVLLREDFDPSRNSFEVMTDVFNQASKIIRTNKNQICSLQGLRGQLALQLNMYQRETTTDYKVPILTQSDVFVACHFAELEDLNLTKLYINSDGDLLTSPSMLWCRQARFPTPSNDPLLYLMFLGFDPFQFKNNRSVVSLKSREAWSQVSTSDHGEIGQLQTGKAVARSNSGDLLEAFAGVAFGCASRVQSYGGMTLNDFVKELFVELCGCKQLQLMINMQDSPWSDEAFQHRFSCKKIPYMSSPNGRWPKRVYSIPGCYFADLKRTVNSEQIDFSVSWPDHYAQEVSFLSRLSGECKNLQHRLSLKKLKGILTRVPILSSNDQIGVHFVVVTKLQNEYFIEPNLKNQERFVPWEKWCEQNLQIKVNVAKVALRGTAISLLPLSQNMKWIAWGECNALVLIYEVQN